MALKLFAFTWENIKNAPNKAGVYVLYDDSEIIYVGRAKGGNTTICSRLSDHKNGHDGTCTQGATHYKREVTDSPVSREKEWLKWHKEKFGYLPRCNDRIG